MDTVALIGTINIDQKIYPIKDLPGWDQECVIPNMEFRSAGTSINVAFPLSRLGVKTNLIGCVGNDSYGRQILDEVKSAGISVDGVDIVPVPTGISTLMISECGEYSCITYLGSSSRLNLERIMNHFDLILESKFVFFTGYFLSPGLDFEDISFLMKEVKRAKKTILFETGKNPLGWRDNTNREIRELLRYVDYFIPSMSEASAISSKNKPEEIAEDLRSCGVDSVIITLNNQGCIAAAPDGIHHVTAFPVAVFDTLGAGDCFNAGFVYGLLQNWRMDKTLKFCNMLCSIYVSRRTNRYPTMEEIEIIACNGG